MLATLRSTPAFFLKPLEIARGYRRADLQADLIAGLTVGVVLLPQAIAFALVAGLPPAMGLYAAVVGAVVGALFGSSRHLHTGPTNSSSLLVFSTLIPLFAAGSPEYLAAAGMLAVLAGALRLALGLARLGLMVNFVSEAVTVGFTAGSGALIITGQVSQLLGVPSARGTDVFSILSSLAQHAPEANLPSLLIGLAALAIILALQRLLPRVPAALLALVAAGAAVWLLRLDARGVNILGALPRGLPPITALPVADLALVGQIAGGASALAAIGLVESASIARAIATHSRQRMDTNQEFVGQGLANMACGIFSGYPVTGSFNRSALAFRSGGRTAMAAVFSGAFVLLAMNLFATPAGYLPRPAIAAVQIVAAWSMIDRRTIMRIWRGARGEAVIMTVTILLTLLMPLQYAVLAGILMSLAYYILQTATPRVQSVLPADNFRHWQHQPAKPPCPQLAVVEVLGDLYFGAVGHIEDAVHRNFQQHPGQRFLLLRMPSVNRCDMSGILALESIVRTYRAEGGDVYLTRVQAPVRAFMRAASFETFIGADHFLDEDEAIGFLFHRVIDPAICIYECPVRAFWECQNLPKRDVPLPEHIHTPPPPEGVREVAPNALWQQLRTGAAPLVVDVREPLEYAQGHVPNAELRPLPALLAGADGLPADRPIVLVCRSGRRSLRAAGALLGRGYRDVAILQGGMVAWERDNLLTATGEPDRGMRDEWSRDQGSGCGIEGCQCRVQRSEL
jgi:SulP family sulfate permease